MKKRGRPKLSQAFRDRIRYRQGYQCAKCAILLPPYSDLDHIIPWSISHDNSEDNLQFLCPNCHREKTVKECILRFDNVIVEETPTNKIREYNDKFEYLDKTIADIKMKKPAPKEKVIIVSRFFLVPKILK